MRRAAARPAFRRLLAAQTISRAGDTFNMVAVVVVVYQLTGSGLQVAGTVAFEVAPVILFGVIAGAVVDRYDRRVVMVAADLSRAAVAVSLVLVHDQVAVIYLAAFLLSAASVFFNPAASSILPAVVAEDEILGANSALWSSAVISQIALAPLAGALVAIAGAGPAFAINAATFVASAGMLRGLRLASRPVAARARHRADVAEGLRAIRASRFLTVLAGVQGLAALSAGATSALLVVLAGQHLGVGAGQFGLLIGAIGVGAGLGPLLMQRVFADARRPSLLFGPYLLRGLVDLVLAAASNFAIAAAALAVYGLGTSTGTVAYNSVLQTSVPDRLRGRVFAFYDVVWQTARMTSIAVGGVVADRFGITAVYWAGAVLLLAAGSLGLLAGRPSSVLTE
ncbi:MAG: MFS transporter [Actinobacteria bacterium]|nr:MFS transporter [Actinomycetota bacterium]